MEVLFLDVGFGTCNILLLGSGEAIVIDAGGRSKEPIAALHHFGVQRIVHLIISHWHDDHVGGATGVLQAYASQIDKVWFPFDPAFRKTEFWHALKQENAAGTLPDDRIEPLLVKGTGPATLWSSPALGADLSLVSPSFMENNLGVASGNSNSTCGVLVLRVGTQRVVFAGDATLAQWEKVQGRISVPINAGVLAVPHHAGCLWPGRWTPTQTAAALDRLYSDLVKPGAAIISAGTRPGRHHPREDVVAALRRANSRILCTQMTARCTSDLEAARDLQQRSLPVLAPGRSSPTALATKAKQPNHVACAGSVLVEVLASGTTIRQLALHQNFVSAIPNSAGILPLCCR